MRPVQIAFYFGALLIPASLHSSGTKAEKGTAADTIAYKSPFYEDNEKCFKCHGQKQYEYLNENLGHNIRALMYSELIIGRDKFYTANHKDFSCTDCHSAEYAGFPHKGTLRMEQMFDCLDCHGGDEKFATFNFEQIETQYQKSVHFKLENEGFTCWKCHGPHDYKISIRKNEDVREAILYDNNICLRCHANFDRFKLLTNREEINIIQKHEWLPNQESHFRNVRCIECHTAVSDTVLVSHLILPGSQAVRKCNECHSQNSLLMSTLYKFQSREQRKYGFLNGIILNQSYVIGANRNALLNILSLAIFGIVAIVVAVHIVFRVLRK
jgi:hypothetical protein